MPLTLKIRPVHSWSACDEAMLKQALGELEYEQYSTGSGQSVIRQFKAEKTLSHNLWAESNDILARLIPTLHCLFKFELKDEVAWVRRWNEVTGHHWFDLQSEEF